MGETKLSRNILKVEAKRIYKQNTKNIPKRNRILFKDFFKKYCQMKHGEQNEVAKTEPLPQEDFNFEDMVNVNTIDDNSLEAVEDAGELKQ